MKCAYFAFFLGLSFLIPGFLQAKELTYSERHWNRLETHYEQRHMKPKPTAAPRQSSPAEIDAQQRKQSFLKSLLGAKPAPKEERVYQMEAKPEVSAQEKHQAVRQKPFWKRMFGGGQNKEPQKDLPMEQSSAMSSEMSSEPAKPKKRMAWLSMFSNPAQAEKIGERYNK